MLPVPQSAGCGLSLKNKCMTCSKNQSKAVFDLIEVQMPDQKLTETTPEEEEAPQNKAAAHSIAPASLIAYSTSDSSDEGEVANQMLNSVATPEEAAPQNNAAAHSLVRLLTTSFFSSDSSSGKEEVDHGKKSSYIDNLL